MMMMRATCPCHPAPSAGYLIFDTLFQFDPATMTWTLLSNTDDYGRPSSIYGHGFTSAEGRLYVHGGMGYKPRSNKLGARCTPSVPVGEWGGVVATGQWAQQRARGLAIA